MTATDELVELLSRRHDLLRSLSDAPRERHELVDHVEASKSTVYKGVSQLTDLELLESTPDGLRPTLAGELALRRYDELASVLDGRSLLATFPAGTVDSAALVGAEVVTPDSHSVNRPLARAKAMIEQADNVRGFTPALAPDQMELFSQRVLDGDLTVEFVFTTEIADYLRRTAPDVLDELAAAEGAVLRETDDELPFTLLVVGFDGHTEVGVELWEDGVVVGLLVNDTTDSRRWAESAFERYRQGARRVTD